MPEKVEITFASGVDQKTDERLVAPGRLLAMENAEFDRSGAISKMRGYAGLSGSVFRGAAAFTPAYSGPVTRARGLATLDDELVLFEGEYALTWFEAAQKWGFKGRALSVPSRVERWYEPDSDLARLQVVTHLGVTVFAWVEANTELHYMIVDEETGAIVLNDTTLFETTPGSNAVPSLRLLGLGDRILLLYSYPTGTTPSNYEIRTAYIDVTAISSSGFVAGSVLAADLRDDRPFFDVEIDVADPTRFACAYHRRGTVGTHLVLGADTGAPLSVPVSVSEVGAGAVAVTTDGSHYHVGYFADNGQGGYTLKRTTFNSGLSPVVTAETLIETVAIDALVASDGESTARVGFWCHRGTVTDAQIVYATTVRTTAGTVRLYDSAAERLDNCRIASKHVRVGGFSYFFGAVSFATTPAGASGAIELRERGYVLFAWQVPGSAPGTGGGDVGGGSSQVLDQAVPPVAVGFYQVGFAAASDVGDGGASLTNQTAQISATGTAGEYTCGLPVLANIFTRVTEVSSAAAARVTETSLISAGRAVLEFEDLDSAFNVASNNRNLHITGGTGLTYDRLQVTDAGFPWAPRCSLTAVSSGGSLNTSVRHQFALHYFWVDRQGQTYNGPISYLDTQGLSGWTGSAAILTLKVWPYNITDKDVRVHVYHRQVGADAQYARITDASGLQVGRQRLDPQNDVALIFNAIADFTDQRSNVLLYTEGGLAEAVAAPSHTCATEWLGRIWIGGTEDGSLWYSRSTLEDEGVTWLLTNRVPVGNTRDPVVALVGLESFLVVFKRYEAWIIQGEVADDTLSGGSRLQVIRLPVDTGCISPKSVVRVPDGVMYQAQRGIYLLDRGGRVTYAGKEVEGLLGSGRVRAAILEPERQQVRFAVSGGTDPILVYDYQHGQWHSYTDGGAVGIAHGGMVLWRGSTAYALAAGSVNVQAATPAPQMRVESAWLRFDTALGTQRVHGCKLLCRHVSSHRLRVRVAYDYDDTWVDVFAWEPGEVSKQPEVFEFRLSRPQHVAFKVEIVDEQGQGFGGGEALVIEALVVDVDLDQNSWDVPVPQRRR